MTHGNIFARQKIKRAQVQAQVFVYIMVLIVAAGILIYGYQAIKGFKKSADDILYAQFRNTFEGDMEAMTFGSVKVKTYELPSKVEQVCLRSRLATSFGDITSTYRLIADAVKAGTKDNVFLYPNGEISFFTGIDIELGGQAPNEIKFKCFDVKQGKLIITVEGKGRSILIT